MEQAANRPRISCCGRVRKGLARRAATVAAHGHHCARRRYHVASHRRLPLWWNSRIRQPGSGRKLVGVDPVRVAARTVSKTRRAGGLGRRNTRTDGLAERWAVARIWSCPRYRRPLTMQYFLRPGKDLDLSGEPVPTASSRSTCRAETPRRWPAPVRFFCPGEGRSQDDRCRRANATGARHVRRTRVQGVFQSKRLPGCVTAPTTVAPAIHKRFVLRAGCRLSTCTSITPDG